MVWKVVESLNSVTDIGVEGYTISAYAVEIFEGVNDGFVVLCVWSIVVG